MFQFLYPQTGSPHSDLHHQKAISISKLMAVEAAINAEYHSYEIGLQLPNREWTITGYPFGRESLSFPPPSLSFRLLRKKVLVKEMRQRQGGGEGQGGEEIKQFKVVFSWLRSCNVSFTLYDKVWGRCGLWCASSVIKKLRGESRKG